jgi:hypothetical protein
MPAATLISFILLFSQSFKNKVLNHYDAASYPPALPWQCLYFLPLPQGHGSLRPTFFSTFTGSGFCRCCVLL